MASRTGLGLGIVGILALSATLVFAQPGGGMMGGGMGMGRGGGMMGGGPRMSMEEMASARNKAILERANFSASEKSAALQALKTKTAAATKLQKAHAALMKVLENTKASDAAAASAASKFQNALSAYHSSIAATDKALLAKLSKKSRARAIGFGIVDNGLGNWWMPLSGGMMMPGMGRGGGMMGGGMGMGRGGMMGGRGGMMGRQGQNQTPDKPK